MQNNFVNEFVSTLNGKLSEEDLKVVQQELYQFSNNYDIRNRCNEAVQYPDQVPKFYHTYMVSKKIEGLSKESLKTYNYYLMDFFTNINIPLHMVTPNDIRSYLCNLQLRRNLSNRSLDGRRLVINTFFEWCVRENYLQNNPCANIAPIKFQVTPREPLTGIELELVRDACVTYRDKAMVELLYSTGCRVSEMVRLNKSDINFNTKEVYLLGKGNKYRKSFINPKAEVSLQKYLYYRQEGPESGDALFISQRRPYARLSKNGIEKIISDIGVRSEIGRNLYPHLIRHTTATDAISRGMPIAEVKELLGHEKMDTTMIYAKVSNENVKYDHRRFIV